MNYDIDILPKSLKETLCRAQAALSWRAEVSDKDSLGKDLATIQAIINACDIHRPVGPNGKHGNRHTKTCGCEITVHLKHFKDGFPLCWPMDKDGDFVGTKYEDEVGCPDCLELIKDED